MGYKKILGIISIVSFVIFLSTILICYSPWGDICRPAANESIALSFILFTPSIFLISPILVFTHEEVFHSWKKFALGYLPVAAIILFITAGESGGGIGAARIDGEIISWFLSGLFLFISLIIIAVKSWKLREGLNK